MTGSSTGKDGASLQWTRASVQDDGFLDFYSEYPHCYAVAYAYTEIESPESGPATILFGSDDGARIWVNDNLVFDKLITRSAVKDEEKIPLLLEKGLNRILVKVEQNVGGWGFFLRLTGMVHAENTK